MVSGASLRSSQDVVFDQSYEILDTVGRGRGSVVYKARRIIGSDSSSSIQANLNNFIALKVLVNSQRQAESIERRIRREALAMLAAKHGNVIRLFDYTARPELSYIVMEYAARGDLRMMLERRQGPLSPDLVLRLMAQVFDGLAAIHRAGIIHRDIKPQNLLLTEEGSIKIADFGIADLPTERAAESSANRGLGTIEYLAPETLSDNLADEKTDIYAAGITFYQLLTGEVPFTADSLSGQIEQKLTGTIPSLEERVGSSVSHIDELLQLMLARDPEKRSSSAADLRDIIVKLIAGEWQSIVRPTSTALPISVGPLSAELEYEEDSASENEWKQNSPVADIFSKEETTAVADELPWLANEPSPLLVDTKQELGARDKPAASISEKLFALAGRLILIAVLVILALTGVTYFHSAEGARAAIANLLPASIRGETQNTESASVVAATDEEIAVASRKEQQVAVDSAGIKNEQEARAGLATPAEIPLGDNGGVFQSRYVGTFARLFGNEPVSFVLSPVAAHGSDERIAIVVGIPGWKPVIVSGSAFLRGQEIDLRSAGLQLSLRREFRADEDANSILHGVFRDHFNGRSGKWRAAVNSAN